MRTQKLTRTSSLALLLMLIVTAFAQAADQVASSPTEVRPLLIGAEVPAVQYKTGDGSSFDLKAAVMAKPTIVFYYRGGW